MRRSVDRTSFVAGLAFVGLGTLLLLDRLGAIDLRIGLALPALLVTVGAILLTSGLSRRVRRGSGSWQTGAGVGLLALAGLLLLRELGIWSGDALVWPVVIAAAGVALVWREMAARASRADPATISPLETLTQVDASASANEERLGPYRGGFGVALVLGAGLLFLWANGALGAASDAALALFVVLIAAGLLLAPLWWRMGRSLADERAERIRSQERAAVAAHLHDSVLQTLALVQKSAADPAAVASLARRQERELRSWLTGARPAGAADTFTAALQSAADSVEDSHRVAIESVIVGERPLDPRLTEVVAAAREALVNAAKYGAGQPVSLYAEVSPDAVRVFIRDRGPGFDLGTVAPERRGVRDAIVGRMQGQGGEALIRSGPGSGTEIELRSPK